MRDFFSITFYVFVNYADIVRYTDTSSLLDTRARCALG